MLPGSSSSGSTGIGSSGFMPSAVALITISHPCGSGGPERVLQPVAAATDSARSSARRSSTSNMVSVRAPADATANAIALPAPPGADEKNGFVRRVITFPLHSEHATEAIEHGADPASIVIATDDVECADLTSSRI